MTFRASVQLEGNKLLLGWQERRKVPGLVGMSIPPLMGFAAFVLSKYDWAGEVSATGYAVILPLSRQVCIQFKPAHLIGDSHSIADCRMPQI